MKTVATILALALSTAVLPAAIINGHDPATHDLFNDWNGTPTRNLDPGFVGSGFDFTGVGHRRLAVVVSVTLLGPNHVIYANHLASNGAYSFYNAAGTEHLYYVRGGASAPIPDSDLRIAPIYQDAGFTMPGVDPADGINWYTPASAALPTDFIGEPVIVVGHRGTNSPQVGIDVIDGVQEDVTAGGNISDVLFFQDNGGPNEIFYQGGDSGGPSFVVDGGQMYLAGVHYAIDTSQRINIDTLLSYYQTDIEMLTGVSFHPLTVSTVPEPGTLAGLLVLLLGGYGYRLSYRQAKG